MKKEKAKKENAFMTWLAVLLVIGSLLDTETTDGIYIAVTLGFFGVCIAYTEWCGRL